MLAARMYNKKDIRVEEVPTPVIGEDEILLRVKAAAICGTDVRMVNNGYKGISPETPRILGHELSGIIERVGSRVTAYRPGSEWRWPPTWDAGSAPTAWRETPICAAPTKRWASTWTAGLPNTWPFPPRRWHRGT